MKCDTFSVTPCTSVNPALITHFQQNKLPPSSFNKFDIDLRAKIQLQTLGSLHSQATVIPGLGRGVVIYTPDLEV